MKNKNIVLIILLLLVAIGFISWWFNKAPNNTPIENDTSLTTYTDTQNGITFQYPETLEKKYISTVDWPPKVQITEKPFNCSNAGSEIMPAGESKTVTINDTKYCVTKESEGAAGSTYIQYAYAFEKNAKVPILTFTLRFPQCANYDDPKKTECETERTSFDIDTTIDKIATSLKF